MIITLCSTVDFSPQIIEIKKQLEAMGHSVNIPFFTEKILNGEINYQDYMASKEKADGDIALRNEHAASTDLFRRYWNFIQASDAILVINLNKKCVNGYIGGNALMEMGFAYGFGKKIYLYQSIPARSERMHYVDEIIDMDPIVINADLSLIK